MLCVIVVAIDTAPGARQQIIVQSTLAATVVPRKFVVNLIILCFIIQLVPGHITQKVCGQDVVDVIYAVTSGSKLSRYDIGQFDGNRISVQF